MDNTSEDIKKKDCDENFSALCFQTIPIGKLVILSVLSGGIYHIIWSYGCWKSLKDYNELKYKYNPVFRGFFPAFTNFELFPIFKKYFEELKSPKIPFV